MAFTLIRHACRLVPLATIFAALALPSPASAAGDCTKYAAPNGSDSAAGSEDLPFRTAQQLAYSLEPGDVGCLRAGTYSENVELTEAGSPSARISLQSYPGERALIVGELAIRAGADYTTVANLDLNGKNSGRWASPAVSADHAVFEGNDITNDHTAICFLIGTATRARHTVIRDNRIHDCGRLPATNREHGVYVQAADDTQILNNLIYDNADHGIQLYPDAQRTLIKGNVIDGNGTGIIFSGDHGEASHDNVVENNLITNSKIRWNVEYYYDPGEPIGRGNVVRNNCIHGGANGDSNGGISRQVGFTATDNVVADPKYASRGTKDFALASDSPCAGMLSGSAAPSQPDPKPVAPGGGGGKVTLQIPPVVARPVQQVLAVGRVSVPEPQSQAQPRAKAKKRRVLVQRRTKRGWRTVAKARLGKGSRFRTRVRVRARRGQRVIRMRAVVRSVASSRVRRVKVRHR
jgi:parallel beta-helix repeat protein